MRKKGSVLYGFSGLMLLAFILNWNSPFFDVNSLSANLSRVYVSEKATERQPYFLMNDSKWADSVLKTLTLEQKIAQFFMVAAWSSDKKENSKEINQWIEEYGIGGLIFFQGTTHKQKELTKQYQSKSKIPLLIGMDAEWGPAMRLSNVERYPYQLTLGATNNEEIVRDAGYWMGRECLDLGVHINFAPVVDVNVNHRNPVISFRSFGENPRDVARLAVAFTEGMENAGVMACVKHFPGHGDTDKDSHEELPVVNHTIKQFQAVDFLPFEHTIRGGVSSVMVAHLNVPALDSSGTPSSLSSAVIQNWLQDSLGFTGLVISDALNMKGVANQYGKVEVVVKAFLAGNDILLFPESVGEAIEGIKKAVVSKRISEEEVNRRCKKVLQAKYWAVHQHAKKETISADNLVQIELLKRKAIRSAITIARNENGILPIKQMTKKTALLIVGKDVSVVQNRILDYLPADVFTFTDEISLPSLMNQLADYERIISVFVAETNWPTKNYGFGEKWKLYVNQLNVKQEQIGVFLGNPYALSDKVEVERFDAIVLGYENSPLTQDILPQILVGALPANGRLPVTLHPTLKREASFKKKSIGRLEFTIPEELGINRQLLAEIDSLAMNGIKNGAYPGCQVVVAQHGKVFYRKNFGHYTYDKSRQVTDRSVYDLASITKVAASTLCLMDLAGQGKFSLDSTLYTYLPELVDNTPYRNLKMRDILTHQAGLTPWIPFFNRTMTAGNWHTDIYSTEKKEGYSVQVAEDLYIIDSYGDSIMKRILETSVKTGQGYKYSDVGYYFMKEIIKKLTGETIDVYALNRFYAPMGLTTTRYNPLNYFPKEIITPTEQDKSFRKQLIHGYVHDQGAAMVGGVGGHAGLFSNAIDLAALMQMILNKGTYGGERFLNESIVNQFTKTQYPGSNRRAIGFDKPVSSLNGGPTCNLVSLESYGHTGFTGTMTWVDPKNGVNYIFLSNRVYPDAENKKLLNMSTRTEIQRVIYQAIQSKKKFD
jgi:beta-N-acetylhexosaminidase